MVEGITCYERDETLCEDGMCLRLGCRLRNDRLSAQQREPVDREAIARVIRRAMIDNPTGGTFEERDEQRKKIADEYAAAYYGDPALLPAQAVNVREPVVRVEKLKWRDHSFGDDVLLITSRDDYRITKDSTCEWPYILRPFVSGASNYQTIDEAKSAAQADYEQRIMAAIEITRSDHTSKSTAARTDAGKTGVTAGETATNSDGGSPGPSPLAVKPGSSDPASGRSQPSPDVNVDELLLRLDASQKACFDAGLHIAAMDIQSARAFLARYKIERLDRLASGRR